MRFPTGARPRHRAVFLGLFAAALLLAAANARAQAQGGVGPTTPVQPPPPPEFDPATEPAVRAVAQVMPAVVNIATERVIRRQVRDPFEDFYERFFGDGSGGSGSGGRVLQQKVKSLGSGFVVDADGLIVTNEHVVERAGDMKIQVTFADGASYAARYLAGDVKTDLALIKIDQRGKQFPHIDLGALSPNLLGQTVLALGNPVGYNSSVSRGILSATNREITIDNVTFKGLLQTDAAINPGNSGGPIIDLAGRLVGMSSVKMAFTPQGTPTQGLGFAIPGKIVANKVADLRRSAATGRTAESGPVDRNATPNARRLFGLTLKARDDGETGLVVAAVEPDSPASQKGIRPGMIVLKVGTYTARDPTRIDTLLRDVPGGTAVDWTLGPVGSRRTLLSAQATTVTLLARASQEL